MPSTSTVEWSQYKGNECLMKVLQSDKKLLIFASSISPPKIILFEKY